MTERDRMRAGLPFDSRDPELLQLYHRARPLLRRYNDEGMVLDAPQRLALLRDLLGEVGDGAWIEPPLLCDYGAHISVGDGTFVHYGATLLDSADIRLGRHVLVGPRVTFCTATHPLAASERLPSTDGSPGYATLARPIAVHDGAWIGASATVLPGVTIGTGAVVAAGAVVSRDVLPHTLVAGVPARFVRSTDAAQG